MEEAAEDLLFSSGQHHPHASSVFNPAGNREPPINPNNNEGPRAQRVVIREQDQHMPIANIIRIMRRILPPHAKISDEAKETVQECVSEYISFITSEANHRCREEQRKTVTAEDVLWAMQKLGFDDYVEPLTVFLSRYRDGDGGRYGPRAQHVMTPEDADAPAHSPPPPHYGLSYPANPNPMGSRAGGLSSGPAYYDPFAYWRQDRL